MKSTIMKQTCAKCSKGGGIAMCIGCQQLFCVKHFIEHRQELSTQIDNIGQEHDLLRRDLNFRQNTDALCARINQWEQESIQIIQENARKARTDLQQLIEKDHNELTTKVGKLTEDLRTYRESDDYTEVDIQKWTEQLKVLRQMIENQSIIKIESDNNSRSTIPSIKLTATQQQPPPSVQVKQEKQDINCISSQFVPHINEKFAEFYGDIALSADGLSGYCSKYSWDGACISGAGRYSSKKHHIPFRIEKKNSEYLFFGIITASQELTSRVTASKSVYGWWELDFTVTNGRTKTQGQNKLLNTGDEVTLILDCDNQRIQFQHHQTNLLVDIPIDLNQCPFPWKILTRLDSPGDFITIVS